MKRKLWFNLFICYILAAVFMFTLLNTFGINRIEKKMTKEKRDVLYNEAASISSEYMNSFYKNQTSLDRLTNQIKVIGNILNARIWIVNKSGLVISDTRPEDSKVKEINVLNIDPDFLSETFSDYTVMPGVLREPMLSVVLPVSYNYQVQGFIVIHSALSQISNDAIYFVDGINLIFLAFLAFLCILFFVIYFFTIAPLSKLNKAAKEYTSGNYSYPLKLDRSDEYGDLANSLSYMAGEMNKLDDYQKKFVAKRICGSYLRRNHPL